MKLAYLKGVTTLAFDPGRCVGCGMCPVVCPHGVFRMAGGAAEIADRDACMECGACARNCAPKSASDSGPRRESVSAAAAISVDAGVGCATALIAARVGGADPPGCG
jgi:ferredoxin